LSSRENRRAFHAPSVVAALSIVLAWGTAHAFELRAWPLLEIHRTETESSGRIFGPILEWHRSESESSFALRPLFETSRSSAESSSRGSLLYPVASWQSSKDELSVRFLGLGSYLWRAAPLPDQPYTHQFRLFPILFYHSGPDTGSSVSVVPLYADLEHFFGYERVRMFLFPLYLKVEQPLYERTWLPFPFFSQVGGRSGEGFRLWPIYGHTVLGADYESRYVAWPFYIRGVEHPGREDETVTRISWPLFSSLDGPLVHSRSYGFLLILPLYTHTIDLKSDTEIEGFPWPAWTRQTDRKTGRRMSLRLMPFYQDRVTPTMESVFYLWPIYRRHTGLGPLAGYERRDVLFFFYRDQIEGEGDERLATNALVPLWISRTPGDSQALTFLDGVLPKNEALQRLYAPLYRLYGTDGGRSDLLWGMWTWSDGKIRPPWYLSFDE
jgi:hypothetical protein